MFLATHLQAISRAGGTGGANGADAKGSWIVEWRAADFEVKSSPVGGWATNSSCIYIESM